MFYYQFWQLFELLPGRTIAHLLLWQCTDLTFELIFTESRWIHFSHEKKNYISLSYTEKISWLSAFSPDVACLLK